jgi:hypothetical protein
VLSKFQNLRRAGVRGKQRPRGATEA